MLICIIYLKKKTFLKKLAKKSGIVYIFVDLNV